MNQATRFRSTEEQRAAEEAARNEQRVFAWRLRYARLFGQWPHGDVSAHRRTVTKPHGSGLTTR